MLIHVQVPFQVAHTDYRFWQSIHWLLCFGGVHLWFGNLPRFFVRKFYFDTLIWIYCCPNSIAILRFLSKFYFDTLLWLPCRPNSISILSPSFVISYRSERVWDKVFILLYDLNYFWRGQHCVEPMKSMLDFSF